MSELIVLAFKNGTDAGEMRDKLEEMQKIHLLALDDATVLVRKQDGEVKVWQAVNLVGTGALGGAYWGILIGLLFFAPWPGLAIGAATGALGGAISDYGVDDKFIKEVGGTIEPGLSTLFLLVRDVTPDRVKDELVKFDATVLQTSLSKEDEAKLKDACGVAE